MSSDDDIADEHPGEERIYDYDDSYNEDEDNYQACSDEYDMDCELSDSENKKEDVKKLDLEKHALHLLKNLKSQKDENKNLDLKIILSTDEAIDSVFVHKCVVSAYVPYVKGCLDNMPPKEDQTLDLSHLNGNSVLEIINWIYSGTCELTEQKAQDVLISADYLCIEELSNHCVDFLCSQLSFENCSEIYTLANNCTVHDFPKRVYDYILSNFYQLLSQLHLDSLPTGEIIKFTSDDNLLLNAHKFIELNQSDHEFQLFQMVKEYISRKDEFDLWPEFLTKSVRLGLLTTDQLKEINANYKWLGNCKEKEKCKQLIKGILEKPGQLQFDIWSTPRLDTRVFKYAWTNQMAYSGSQYFSRPEVFNDLKSRLDKKNDRGALIIVRGVKVWLREWDDIVVVGGISLTYNDGTTEHHGLSEAKREGVHEFKLKDGEYIDQVDYRAGFLVDQITFHTNLANKYGPYGGVGGSAGSWKPRKPNGFFAAMRGERSLSHEIPVVRREFKQTAVIYDEFRLG